MNVIARLWPHSLLAGHYKNDGNDQFIIDGLDDLVGMNSYDFDSRECEGDYVYVCETHSEIVICARGTHGKKGWRSNLRCRTTKEGFEEGFAEGAERFVPWLVDFVKSRHNKHLLIGGHSRGGPIASLVALRLKQKLGKYSKPITYCSPLLADKKGIKVFEEEGIEPLNMISHNDFIDNLGAKGFFGRRPGKDELLPPSREYTFKEKLLDLIPGWGHAYSEVTDGLVQYFYKRGMEREAKYLKSVRYLADI